MRTNAKIDQVLEQIVALHLTLGVQPSEVADAGFDAHYESVEISRRQNSVVMTVVFFESEDGCQTRHALRYAYDNDRRLQRIEQKVGGGSFRVQWSRQELHEQLLRTVVEQLGRLNCCEDVERFISQVPGEIGDKIRSALQAAA